MAREQPTRPALAVLAAVLGGSVVAGAAPEPRVRLTPPAIEMGAFYNGARIKVEGTAEAGAAVLVVIRGADVEEVFNRKGRVGPIWVTTGKVHISGVPALFLSYAARPVAAILDRQVVEAQQLDEGALKRQMRVQPRAMDQEIIRDHYLKLKREEGTLQVFDNAVKMGRPGEQGVPFTLELDWPKKAPPARYELRVYQCRDRAIVHQSSMILEVKAVGFPAGMAGLARSHGPLYGFIAVLIAAMAGFGMDYLASRLTKGKKLRRRLPELTPEEIQAVQPPATRAATNSK